MSRRSLKASLKRRLGQMTEWSEGSRQDQGLAGLGREWPEEPHVEGTELESTQRVGCAWGPGGAGCRRQAGKTAEIHTCMSPYTTMCYQVTPPGRQKPNPTKSHIYL